MGMGMIEDEERIGVFGGTFDPIHLAHVAWAEAAIEELGLDAVLFVVAGDPWMKTSAGRSPAPGPDRLEMVRLAIDAHPELWADGRELDRPGPTHTADTLEDMASRYPGAKFFLLVGADCLPEMANWERPSRVLELCSVAVLPRSGAPVDLSALDRILPGAGARAVVLDAPELDVSSTQIRGRIAAGDDTLGLLHSEVGEFIERAGLYRRTEGI